MPTAINQKTGERWELIDDKWVPIKPAAPTPVDFSAATMLENVPASAGRFLKDLATPLLHPQDTAEALGRLGMGVAQKAVPGMFADFPQEMKEQNEAVVNAVGKAIVDRYGSVDAFKKTLMDDPVGALSDIAGVVSVGGGLVKAGASAVSRAVPAASKVAKAAGAVQAAGAAVDPLNLATSPIKAGIGMMTPRGLPAALYESAAKFPPVSVPAETRKTIVEAALNTGIMPTHRGIAKINAILTGFDTRIDELVQQADASGKVVPRGAIYKELSALKKELSGGAFEAQNLEAMRGVIDALESRLQKGPKFWTPSRLQEFKVKTYRDINWKPDPDASTATAQAMARGARKEMAGLSPEIDAINKQYGPLAELRDRLPQVANRIDNTNPLPLTAPLYTGTGTILGQAAGNVPGIGAAIGAVGSLLNSPRIAAGAALYLRHLQNNKLFNNFVDNSLLGLYLRQALAQSGRVEELRDREK